MIFCILNVRIWKNSCSGLSRQSRFSKLKYPQGQEAVDMCVALEEMKMDSKLEGSVETYREVGFSLQETIQRIAEKFSLSLQKSEAEVKKYWK